MKITIKSFASIEIGKVYEDQDKRMEGRRLTVARLEHPYVVLATHLGTRKTRIRWDRLTDLRLWKLVAE